jgi:hypothetical protein
MASFAAAAHSAVEGAPPLTHAYRPPRTRTCLGGKLVYGEGDVVTNDAFTLDCAIHDISEGGAKVTVKPFQSVPLDLYLIVVKFRIAHQARVVWQNFPARGLRFNKSYFMSGKLPEEVNFLRRIWLELSARPGCYE